MMDFLPARNEGVRWNGAVWRVEELNENKATLCHALTGERQALTVAEWFDGVRSGLIERRVRPLPVGSDRPRKHAYMHFRDATWQVAVIRNGIISLRNVETDESGGVSVAKWKSGCLDGSVRMLASPTQQVSGRVAALLKVPVTSLPEGMQEAGKQIAVYVEAWRDPRGFYEKHLPDLPQEQRHLPRTLSKKKLVPFFDVVASVTGMPRPGFSTFCNWLRKVDDAGGDIRGALPRHDLQGPNERHMGATVETMLNQAIDEAWLTQRRNKKKKVWDTLQQRVAKWNEAHPGRPLACPSQGHVARYIRDEVDRYVVARRRGTKEEADSGFKQVGPGVKTTCILERVEVDHSLAKIKVKDDRTGVVLGYPWLTAALDHHSRAVLALHVNFENQSIGANLQALRMVMTPKDWLRKLVPEVDYEYPWGKPTGFFFDRGSDYDNDTIRMIGQSLDVVIDYAVGKQPEMKGVIERFWRSVKEEVVYGLPGAKLPGEREVFGVDPDGEVWMTYSELVRRFWFWVATVYMKSYHRGINDYPLRKWQESEAAMGLPPRPRTADDLNVLLTRMVECPVTVQGVTWNGLNWYGRPLEAIMRNPRFREEMTVKVRLNEYDLSEAWVKNPFTLKDERLKPRLPEYMAGLTPHAHDLILKSAPKKRRGTLAERELNHNRARLFEQEKARAQRALGMRNGAVGSGWAKLNGVGQEAPHGDELGSVLPAPGGDPLAEADPFQEPGLNVPPAATPLPEEEQVPRRRRRAQAMPAPQRFRNRD